MTNEEFFTTIISHTQENYKKIAIDLQNNYNKQGTLTISQATWIKNALKRNKNLRSLEIPEEIQEEMNIALNETEEQTSSSKLVIDREQLNDIILEEFGNMITKLVDRLTSNDK